MINIYTITFSILSLLAYKVTYNNDSDVIKETILYSGLNDSINISNKEWINIFKDGLGTFHLLGINNICKIKLSFKTTTKYYMSNNKIKIGLAESDTISSNQCINTYLNVCEIDKSLMNTFYNTEYTTNCNPINPKTFMHFCINLKDETDEEIKITDYIDSSYPIKITISKIKC